MKNACLLIVLSLGACSGIVHTQIARRAGRDDVVGRGIGTLAAGRRARADRGAGTRAGHTARGPPANADEGS